jgi:hypothetical protein
MPQAHSRFHVGIVYKAEAIHGELMFRQPRKPAGSAARQPDHVAKITRTLSVSVWQSYDQESGRTRMHWDVSRLSSDDPSRTYRTLRVESLLEFPAFLARVAAGFAQTESVGPQLRTELLQFAKDMELMARRRDGNGIDSEEGGVREPVQF